MDVAGALHLHLELRDLHVLRVQLGLQLLGHPAPGLGLGEVLLQGVDGVLELGGGLIELLDLGEHAVGLLNGGPLA